MLFGISKSILYNDFHLFLTICYKPFFCDQTNLKLREIYQLEHTHNSDFSISTKLSSSIQSEEVFHSSAFYYSINAYDKWLCNLYPGRIKRHAGNVLCRQKHNSSKNA